MAVTINHSLRNNDRHVPLGVPPGHFIWRTKTPRPTGFYTSNGSKSGVPRSEPWLRLDGIVDSPSTLDRLLFLVGSHQNVCISPLPLTMIVLSRKVNQCLLSTKEIPGVQRVGWETIEWEEANQSGIITYPFPLCSINSAVDDETWIRLLSPLLSIRAAVFTVYSTNKSKAYWVRN